MLNNEHHQNLFVDLTNFCKKLMGYANKIYPIPMFLNEPIPDPPSHEVIREEIIEITHELLKIRNKYNIDSETAKQICTMKIDEKKVAEFAKKVEAYGKLVEDIIDNACKGENDENP